MKQYITGNGYLIAYLKQLDFVSENFVRHRFKKNIWELSYDETTELKDATDDFFENDDLQEFIKFHVDFMHKIKRMNRNGI